MLYSFVQGMYWFKVQQVRGGGGVGICVTCSFAYFEYTLKFTPSVFTSEDKYNCNYSRCFSGVSNTDNVWIASLPLLKHDHLHLQEWAEPHCPQTHSLSISHT